MAFKFNIGGGAGPGLSASKATYLVNISEGALIAALTDPYGTGSTYSVVGTAPSQLALSNGKIVAGAGAQVEGQATTIVIRVSKGQRAIEEPLTFTALAAVAPTPTPTPTPTPAPTFSGLYVLASRDGSVGQTYTAPSSMAVGKWYREATAKPNTRTEIAGAAGSTYVATAADLNCRLVAVGTKDGAQVEAKSLHVVLPQPLIIESFETLTGWTPASGAELALVTDGVEYGTTRLQMTSTGSTNTRAVKDNIGNFDTSQLGTIAWCGDLGLDEGRMGGSAELIFIRAGADQKVTSSASGAFNSGATDTGVNFETPSPIHIGKRWGAYNVSEIPGLASAGFSTIGLKVQNLGNIPYSQVTKYDALLARAGGRPTIIFSFDDNILSQYTTAYPEMAKRGLRGIFYVASQITQNSSYMSTAMLREMYDAGWDCGWDSTHNDNISSSFGTLAAWEASLQLNRDWSANNNMPRGTGHICWTHGQIETNPPSPRVRLPTSTTNGTNVMTVTDTTGITAGMRAVGHNIPNSPITTVVSIDSATQVTLSANVPAQTKPVYFVDTSPEFYTMKLPKRAREIGIKSARTTRNLGGTLTRFGLADTGMFSLGHALHNTPYADFCNLIDQVILRGTTIEFYTHGVQDNAPATYSELSDFKLKMDYVKTKVDAGLLDNLTWSEVYLRDGSASVPTGLAAPTPGPTSAISYINGSTGNNTPAAVTNQKTGDLLLAFAYRDGGSPAPVLPSGWTQIATDWASNSGYTLCYRYATADGETLPAFTNATNVVVMCYRGVSGIGAVSASGTGASGNVIVPAWTLQKTDGTSWAAYFAGSRSNSSNLDNGINRIGHANTSTTSDAGGSDSLGTITAAPAYTIGTSGGTTWHAIGVELLG